jgi:hypothetical protein
MATDPKKTLPPAAAPASLKNGYRQKLESSMADFSIRELLGFLLSSVGIAECTAYLERILKIDPMVFTTGPCAWVPFPSSCVSPHTQCISSDEFAGTLSS